MKSLEYFPAERRRGSLLGHAHVCLGEAPLDRLQRHLLQRIAYQLVVQVDERVARRYRVQRLQRNALYGSNLQLFVHAGHSLDNQVVTSQCAGFVEAADVDFAGEWDTEGLGAVDAQLHQREKGSIDG